MLKKREKEEGQIKVGGCFSDMRWAGVNEENVGDSSFVKVEIENQDRQPKIVVEREKEKK